MKVSKNDQYAKRASALHLLHTFDYAKATYIHFTNIIFVQPILYVIPF